jgi:hypothetical protein
LAAVAAVAVAQPVLAAQRQKLALVPELFQRPPVQAWVQAWVRAAAAVVAR